MNINILLELEALKMEAKGMEEENKNDIYNGVNPTYNEDSFYDIAKSIRNLKDKISDVEPELL